VKDIALILLAFLLRALMVVPFMLLFWWLRRSARNSRPREEAGLLVFPLNRRMHILIEIVVLALVAFSVLVLVQVRDSGGFYAALIPLAVLAAILLAEPKPVSTGTDGVHLHRWLRGDRVIAWHDIAWVRRGKNTGATYVKSRSGGRPISFSPLLNGQKRFESEIRKHTRGLGSD
jgi:hypothetical protein